MWSIIIWIGVGAVISSLFWSIAYEMLNAEYFNLKRSLEDSERYSKGLENLNRILRAKDIAKEHIEEDEDLLKEIENKF